MYSPTVTSSLLFTLATTQHDSQYNTLQPPRLVPPTRLSMVVMLLEGPCSNTIDKKNLHAIGLFHQLCFNFVQNVRLGLPPLQTIAFSNPSVNIAANIIINNVALERHNILLTLGQATKDQFDVVLWSTCHKETDVSLLLF
jgi:hypothetical protein